MILRPQEYFTIARGLEDHTDSVTYYVRAVVRNARTDALIDTVDLTNQGTRRFSKPWQVPADTSGEGFYILVTTTVYTDSAYTTKSANYGEKFDTYLVQERINPNLGNGGGAEVDYKKVRKIVQEEINKIPKQEMPIFNYELILSEIRLLNREFPEVDLKPLLDKIVVLGSIINSTEKILSKKIKDIPQPKPIDLSSVEERIAKVSQLIKDIPQPEKVDLSNITTQLDKIVETFRNKLTINLIKEKKEILVDTKNIKRKSYVATGNIEENKNESDKEKIRKNYVR